MSDNLDDCFISDDDELASVQASVRAVRDLLEKYDLEDEFEALHLHYLPEELQKRREWLKELRAKHGGKSSYQG